MGGLVVLLVGLLTALMSVVSYYVSPKGNNTSTWQMSLILTFSCCYLLWAITYLAQLHPLEAPSRVLE
ncbi:V-type proton ATPase subunit e [Schizosaccharomyces pombe]|uniref:V-type proton ATPase subunit e n=1 Tax=Schizosaccharomyces pombe (strain 972 / ATCC 24843) TaxID=284812 RepID=VA0E_SCHPO|nr:putative V-type ATPase V0 subunit e [Schizosaccharomyces pombe]Q69Z14.2 RecName: Full=V-type proton ATPase subunit e; Short=V-ATPase subunit e; AltName: Full=Vacuolar proton pump subunit e [Schizosaccharomyces pombe 972h-]CAH05006.2 V-type ATPase V0 subunit e (predicted) [Schizosaccharomyces pombe]|eukprot:NP_001343007.1 putative V-type ATPase V0 subunit e [Schizosaccharomyces pombe]